MVMHKEKRGTLQTFLSLSTFFGTYGSPIQPRRLEDDSYDAHIKRALEHQKNQNEQFHKIHPMRTRNDTMEEIDEGLMIEEHRMSLLNLRADEEDNAVDMVDEKRVNIIRPLKPINKKFSDLEDAMQIKKQADEFRPATGSTLNETELSGISKILPARQCHHLRIRSTELVLGKIIGEGGFGKVYQGKWRGRTVAIKKLSSVQDGNVLEEFASEIEIMRRLRHPNICRLLGACFEPENRSLVIEFLSQGSLWSVLRRKRDSTSDDLRLNFIRDTVAGMSYLHQFHPPILHRDLKSPNLLVDSNYTIKISDFGLSRVKARVSTMTGNCGTVQWMAPEVLDNRKYTEKADVFSFGIVLWEIFTAKCPYEGMNQVQVGLGVLNRNIRPNIPPKCPPFMAHLMRACWQTNPDLRPSFAQIMSSLTEYSNAQRIERQ